MPTIEDLRATLHERADRCDGAAITALATTDSTAAPTRRRMMAPLLAAAAVVAVAGAGAGLGAALSHDPRTSAGGMAVVPSVSPTWQFHIADVPGWTVSYDFAMWESGRGGKPGAWQEGATLTPTTGRSKISYGYEPDTGNGVFPGNYVGGAVHDGRAQAITVNGEQGWWVPGARVGTANLAPSVADDPWAAVSSSGDGRPFLAWKNSDGSWNLLSGTVGFQPKTYRFDNTVAWKAMSRIAKAVLITPSGEPITSPFVPHLGDQYRPIQIDTQDSTVCGTWVSPPAAAAQNSPPPGVTKTTVTICRVPSAQERSEHFDVIPDRNTARRALADGTILLVQKSRPGHTELVPAALVDSIDVSPKLDDPPTWLPLGP